MNPTIFILILMTIMLGTIIVMISSHWLFIWIGFEMNMLSIIPIMMKKHNPRATEASTKYFLTQSTASMLLMMAIIINLMFSGQWTAMKLFNPTASMLMTTALAMKLGMAPFHFWVPEVTQGIPLSSGLILLTWQKLAPMSVLYQILPSINLNLILTLSILSIMIGGWGGLNQTQLRKIMAYSSIAHMGWMTAVLPYNPTMTLLNLIIYIIMTSTMFTLFMANSTTTTLSLSHTWNKTPIMTILVLTTLLSMGGLPPTISIYTKMNNHPSNNKKYQHHPTHLHSNHSTTKSVLLHTTHMLHHTHNIPLHKQYQNKMTILNYKTNNSPTNNNRIIHHTTTAHTNPLNS
nr:NADH dehydrogenase subunit 2 [Arabitragus jayakari]